MNYTNPIITYVQVVTKNYKLVLYMYSMNYFIQQDETYEACFHTKTGHYWDTQISYG